MCGPAVKPIALAMVAEIARDPRPSAAADLGHRRHHHLARRGRIHRSRRRHGAGLHRGDDLRLQGRRGNDLGPQVLHGREGLRDDRRLPRPRGRLDRRLAISQPQLRREGRDQPGSLHQVRPLPHRLRGHLAPGDFRPHRRRSGALSSTRRNASAATFARSSARSKAASSSSTKRTASTRAPASTISDRRRTGRRTRTIRRSRRRRNNKSRASPLADFPGAGPHASPGPSS